MPKSARSPLPRRGGLAALLFAAGAAAPMAHAMTPSEFFAKVSPSVWLVRTYDKDGLSIATGSAVVVAPETLVTNCHVLRKARTFRLLHEGKAVTGTLEMWDPERDVCQVRAPGLNAPAVEFGDSDKLAVGQPVYTLGAPRALELTLSNGLVSSLRRDDAGHLRRIQISAPISHGSSGGGLFDVDGRLIGITSSIFEDAQNLNFALPVAYVRELPARHLAALQQASASPPVAATPAGPPPPPPPPSPPPPPPPPPTIVATTTPPTTPPGAAEMPPLPFLNEARQKQYWHYFGTAPYPKACAISDNGHWACTGGTTPKHGSLSPDPKVRALARCAELAGKACFLYHDNDTVVYRAPVPLPTP